MCIMSLLRSVFLDWQGLSATPLKSFSNRTFFSITQGRSAILAVLKRPVVFPPISVRNDCGLPPDTHSSAITLAHFSFIELEKNNNSKGKHTFQPLWTFLNNVCQSVHSKMLSGERPNRNVKTKLEYFHPFTPGTQILYFYQQPNTSSGQTSPAL